MAAYLVVWECVVEQWLGVRRTTYVQHRAFCRILLYLSNKCTIYVSNYSTAICFDVYISSLRTISLSCKEKSN